MTNDENGANAGEPFEAGVDGGAKDCAGIAGDQERVAGNPVCAGFKTIEELKQDDAAIAAQPEPYADWEF